MIPIINEDTHLETKSKQFAELIMPHIKVAHHGTYSTNQPSYIVKYKDKNISFYASDLLQDSAQDLITRKYYNSISINNYDNILRKYPILKDLATTDFSEWCDNVDIINKIKNILFKEII